MSPRFERRSGAPYRDGGTKGRGPGGWSGPGRDRDAEGRGGDRRDGDRRDGLKRGDDSRYRGRDKRGSDPRSSGGWSESSRGGKRPSGPRSGGERYGGERYGSERNGGERTGSDRYGHDRSGGSRFGSDRDDRGRAPRSGGGERRFEGGSRRPDAGRFSPARRDGDSRPSQGRFRDRSDRFKDRDRGQERYADRRHSGDERSSSRGRYAGSAGRQERYERSAPAAQPEAAAATPPADDLIWGRHATLAALESGRPIHRIWCTPEMRSAAKFLQLLREAKASGVLVEEVTWARLGQITGGSVHQGIALQTAAAETLDLDTLIDGCSDLGEPPLLLALDGVTDPHNLGAIVRSAEAMGAHGVVLPQRRSAGLTGSAAKVAAGALEHMPVARVVNLNRSLEKLKDSGYRVIGLAAEGDVTLTDVDLDGPLVLVTGSEDQGLSLMTRRHCDQLVRIPLRGITPSLNASVATALCVYEVARRNWMKDIHGQAPSPPIVRPRRVVEEESASPSPAADVVASDPVDTAMDTAVVETETPTPSEPQGGQPDPAAAVDPISEPDPVEINLSASASPADSGIRFNESIQLSP